MLKHNNPKQELSFVFDDYYLQIYMLSAFNRKIRRPFANAKKKNGFPEHSLLVLLVTGIRNWPFLTHVRPVDL